MLTYLLLSDGEKIYLKCASHTATLALLINNMRNQLGVDQHVGCEGAEFLKYIMSYSDLWRLLVFLFSVCVCESTSQKLKFDFLLESSHSGESEFLAPPLITYICDG